MALCNVFLLRDEETWIDLFTMAVLMFYGLMIYFIIGGDEETERLTWWTGSNNASNWHGRYFWIITLVIFSKDKYIMICLTVPLIS